MVWFGCKCALCGIIGPHSTFYELMGMLKYIWRQLIIKLKFCGKINCLYLGLGSPTIFVISNISILA
jgi:hypothetical protein